MSVRHPQGRAPRYRRTTAAGTTAARRPSVLTALLAVLLVSSLALASCARGHGGAPGAAPERGAAGQKDTAGRDDLVIPYDVRDLLHPERKYLGMAVERLPHSLRPVREFTRKTGVRPTVVETYVAWGDQFDTRTSRALWKRGAIPYVAWEPFSTTLKDIAKGRSDRYVSAFAVKVRNLNVPVALSFGHEMNGHWYPWGSQKATPAAFVRAWRHIHDLFLGAGATNVIWVWSPNVVNPVPQVALRPYYPGDAYVDWVGLVGYYTWTDARTFPTLFGPTMRQVRRFTKRPFLIAETAAEATHRKPQDVDDLFRGVAAHRDVIGFVWFEVAKRADWRVESPPSATRIFRRHGARPVFHLDVKRPG